MSVELSDELFARLKKSHEFSEENGPDLTPAMNAEIAEVDALLTAFFWEHVNQFLNPRLER